MARLNQRPDGSMDLNNTGAEVILGQKIIVDTGVIGTINDITVGLEGVLSQNYGVRGGIRSNDQLDYETLGGKTVIIRASENPFLIKVVAEGFIRHQMQQFSQPQLEEVGFLESVDLLSQTTAALAEIPITKILAKLDSTGNSSSMLDIYLNRVRFEGDSTILSDQEILEALELAYNKLYTFGKMIGENLDAFKQGDVDLDGENLELWNAWYYQKGSDLIAIITTGLQMNAEMMVRHLKQRMQ